MSRQTEIFVVGGGPAGLSAAIVAAELGAKVLLVDDNATLGGQLIKQTHRFFGSSARDAGIRGIAIAEKLCQEVQARKKNLQVLLNTSAVGFYGDGEAGILSPDRYEKVTYERVVVGTGAVENSLNFENNDLPGIYGAGAVQTLMNVHGIRPGHKILMVGSGNIGLIVSYQLLQAGVQVIGVVEAMPTIGGYLVHASKIRRLGVPIMTGHTIVKALGTDGVTGALLCRLDDKFQRIPNTEFEVACDCICLAVGLSPLIDLFQQAKCKMVYIPELGGLVPLHDGNMRTTNPRVYVAGDASGIEEATTAILGGRIAGARAYESIHGPSATAQKIVDDANLELKSLRAGSTGDRIRWGRERLSQEIAAC
ncbi:MAG: Sarcosine oxidase alpha subunit [Candidatus Ozemobacter sibiricus]|jgi:sarcosine oxidase subunit alpha|uniref:Sarcosine oxidase alpha subunit n=1 Tax=Candidatus Ozemobacter sibiricus TaxID=2268124 RepID=A0A367ZJN7_9BACT|nr:MAG: Sarcosine oxidase alpha subunit [Candidatus Ozemobacter sibiricus]